ncbi:hypothetical protein BDW22DRAFT_473396 [Trametopsis cervina]|nr:hypothetical protein BDW22DRAFT_473396 [Trametopsis cervina]
MFIAYRTVYRTPYTHRLVSSRSWDPIPSHLNDQGYTPIGCGLWSWWCSAPTTSASTSTSTSTSASHPCTADVLSLSRCLFLFPSSSPFLSPFTHCKKIKIQSSPSLTLTHALTRRSMHNVRCSKRERERTSHSNNATITAYVRTPRPRPPKPNLLACFAQTVKPVARASILLPSVRRSPIINNVRTRPCLGRPQHELVLDWS